MSEIDRSELLALTGRVLEGSVGRDIAHRYLLRRTHQEPDRPIVLLIGGVSIVPGAIDLAAFAESAHVIMLLVGVFDQTALRDRFVARAGGQRARLADRYLEAIEGTLEIQRYLVDQAERFDVPVIDNVAFESSVRQIIDLATATLRGAPWGGGRCAGQ